MSMSATYDVIVIGGGPSGMMAAGKAAERGFRVLLIEKNMALGKKLSITGGGRCNITQAEFDTRTLLMHYGDSEQFLYAPFSQFGPEDTFDFFVSKNLPLIIEDKKRAFPKTGRAIDVTQVMEKYVRANGVTVLTGVAVKGFVLDDGVITGVRTNSGDYCGRAYILASGGMSHPDTGSTGEGLAWLGGIGHTVHKPNPDLVPLVVSDEWVKRLSGTTLSGARITFMQNEKKLHKEGDILCTHFGISGPIILNSAREVKKMLTHGNVKARIDLFPHDDIGILRTKLHTLLDVHANKTLTNALNEWFPTGLVVAILEQCPSAIGLTKSHSVVREVRQELVECIKNLSCTITGTRGYEWSIVSDGGVDLKEIDTRTMQSKLHKNLYLIGDVLNVNRVSGGYSLQLCWTTGFVAGDNVLAKQK